MSAVNSQNLNTHSSIQPLSNSLESSSISSDNSKFTELHKWVLNKQVARIAKHIIQSHINSLDSNGRTPLMLAIQTKTQRKASKLLSEGADVDICDIAGKNSLHYAAGLGDTKIFSEILDRIQDISARSAKGHTALYYAVKNNEREHVKELLDRNLDSHEYAQSCVPLSKYAENKGFIEIRDLLLDKQQQQEYEQYIEAIQTADFTRIQALFINYNRIDVQGPCGISLLHKAILCENEEIVHLLIELGANVNVQDAMNATPLHVASILRNYLIVDMLLKAGADPLLVDNDAQTALHYAAAKEDNENTIHLLLSSCASLLDIQDVTKSTALHIATNNRFRTNIEALIAHGANLNIQDISGDTALHLAVNDNITDQAIERIDIVKLLIEKGCNQSIKNEAGNTALMTACSTCSDSEIIFELASSPAHINDVNSKNGNNPLMHAIIKDNLDAVSYLLHNGAKIDQQNIELNTPLHLAAISEKPNNIAIGKLLIQYGSDCNARNRMEITPLGFAIHKEKLEFVKLLLDNNVDTDALCHDGIDAVTYAKDVGHKKIRKALLDSGFEDYQKIRRTSVLHKQFTEKNWQDFISTMLGISATANEFMEGSYDCLIHSSIAYAIDQFSKTTSSTFVNWDEFTSALFGTVDGTGCQEKVQKISQGIPILISSGWKEHSITLVIADNHLFICNRGGRAASYNKSTNVTTYHIDPQKIDAKDIEQLYESRDFHDIEEGSKLIYETLAKKWEPCNTTPSEKKESAKFIKFVQKLTLLVRDQKHYDCSKANMFLGIYVLMLCYHYKNTRGMNNSNTVVRTLYKDATNFVRKFYAQYYLSRNLRDESQIPQETEQFRLRVKEKLNKLNGIHKE